MAMDRYTEIIIKPGTYIITGVTGFIGSMIVRRIVVSELFRQGHINLILCARDEKKYKEMFDDMLFNIQGVSEKGTCPVFCAIEDMTTTYEKMKCQCGWKSADYIIHCAANTKSSIMVSNPVETIDGIVAGTKSVLELAKLEKVKGMVYLSSMEVYGDIKCSPDNRATEDMLGDIDILKPRSSYPLGKRMSESYCAAYTSEYGVPVKIARLAQVFGCGIKPDENRSFAQFARVAAEGKDIVLKTEGKSINNSVASEEAVEAIFYLLYNGENGQAYNVVNEHNTMSIRDMAELVAREISGGKSKVVIDVEDISKTGYAADTSLYMSGEKLRQLGWEAKKGLVDMYRDVVECLQSNLNITGEEICKTQNTN